MSLSSPYVTTLLTSTINLNPRQMNNQIYKNLKDNLIKKVEGKCFKSYGFVSKIYEIKEYNQGLIVAENPLAAASFNIKFSCRLCNPLRNKQIVCKVMKIINGMFINSQNGPITAIITITRINNELFYKDQKTNKLMAKASSGGSGDKPFEITPGTYIIVNIENRTFNDMDTIIMAIGELSRLATKEEIENSFKEEYGVDGENKIIDFEEYIKNNENTILEDKFI